VIPLPDEYVKVAKAELKRQWEENRYALRREDNKAKLDDLNAILEARQKAREQWVSEQPTWQAWAERIESTLPAWPPIDASALPVGQSLFMYGVEK
jgi:sRNA-binding protein